jgi:hypothetical protein
MYVRISERVMVLLQNLGNEYEQYYEEILNLLNTLVYKSSNITNYELPYLLCRKLLEGDNSILSSCPSPQLSSVVSVVDKIDLEYSCVLISILKNLIQKMPMELLKRYPYPSNPELLLCLIENKKLDQGELSGLNTAQVDEQWGLILQSYTALVYGCGSLCDIRALKMLNGVSLYPWI